MPASHVNALPSAFVSALRALFPPKDCSTDPADCWVYGYDNSRRHTLPQAVVFVRSHEQVQALVQLANQYVIPLVAHGRGTATTGAAVPVQQGVVVSFEKMHQIISLEPGNRLMVVEPGITNQAVQEAASKAGFFWAPDPSSAAFSSVGGNLACNAGGPRAVKYGTCRENTLGLRVVTGGGESLTTGVQTTKGVVGYDLTRLIIGAEGTLALITQATLKLLPLPEAKCTLLASFDSIEAATAAIVQLMNQPIVPCALEFMDSMALNLIRDYSPGEVLPAAQAVLLIEVDGAAIMMETAALQLAKACEVPGLLQVQVAQDAAASARLWRVRKALSPLLRHVANQKINEDVVVPVTALPAFIQQITAWSQAYGIKIVNFGHAGNGNIHVNLLFDAQDARQVAAAQACLHAIFELVITLKGTLSGEHGVGLDKRSFVHTELGPVALRLMAKIKQDFDPQGILNPGKGVTAY